MGLHVHLSSLRTIDLQLLLYGAKNLPCLIVDCANRANPHSLYPTVTEDQMRQMYVFELEMIYKFRDVLNQIPAIAKELGARTIIVTTSDHLFNYQNSDENENIYRHCWELLSYLGEKFDVHVGINKGSIHEDLARRIAWGIQYHHSA